MTTTRPLKVFLCHASADKPAVRKLYHYLRERKMDPWLDAEKLLPGQNWQAEIPKALLASDVIIICLSKNSVDKEGYVQKEIKFALDKALEMPDGRIFLIPARLEECDLPESLSAYHYVNLFETDGYRRLLRSLRVRAEQIGATKVSVGKDTVPPNADISASKEAQPEISAPSISQKQAPEPQNETAIDVGGDVSGANIIVGDNNVIQILPKPEANKRKPNRQVGKNFYLSIAFPKLLSKRLSSKFIVQFYLPKNRDKVKSYLKNEFDEKTITEIIRSAELMLGRKVQVELSSPDFEFSKPVEDIISSNTRFLFLGKPKDDCKVANQQVLLLITDVNTGELCKSLYFAVNVVDFAFDHISRPLISNVSSIILGVGSFVMFTLTLLGQIDTTFGFTSGATAALLASTIYARFFAQYQIPKSTNP